MQGLCTGLCKGMGRHDGRRRCAQPSASDLQLAPNLGDDFIAAECDVDVDPVAVELQRIELVPQQVGVHEMSAALTQAFGDLLGRAA